MERGGPASDASGGQPSRLGAAALAFAAPLALLCALSWPLPIHLGTWHLLTAFGDSHVWVFDWLARHLRAGELPGQTFEAGYPQIRSVRIIGWVPALVFLPLQAISSSLAAANLLQLLSLPASAGAAFALLRRWTDAGSWVCAALAMTYALGPTLLSTFAMGEISNTQAWVIPGFLWALDRAARDLRWLPALAAVSLAAIFTSPYFGMALPLLVGGYAFARGRHGARRSALLVVIVGLSLAPSLLYFQPHRAGGGASLFRPAQQSEPGPRLPFPPPVARLDALITGQEPAPRSPFEPTHVSALGLALSAAALGLGMARRDQRGVAAGAALAVGGAVLALGPWLCWGQDYVRVGGRLLPLPVWLLEAVAYPTREGGLYFRYAVLAELGLCLVVAGALAERRRAALWAWALAAVHVAESLWITAALWPRRAEPVADLAVLTEMVGDDGAVLELPLQGPTDAAPGQGALLRAVFHGRPTTALPRDVRPREAVLPELLRRALESDPDEVLRGAGFRYVLLPEDSTPMLTGEQAALVAALGEPTHNGAFRLWDLGPTALAPRAVEYSRPEGGGPARRGRERSPFRNP